MKLKKSLLFVLSLAALASCNRGNSSQSSSSEVSSNEPATSSSSIAKSNYLTQAMLDEISTGYSVNETVINRMELKAGELDGESWDSQKIASTYVQYIDSTDEVYHITQGNAISDTKVDPVEPDAPEFIASEDYFVPFEINGTKVVNYAQLNLANEPEYTKVGNSNSADDDSTTETQADDSNDISKYMLWDGNFNPFFSKMTIDDFEKEKEEKRSFTFSLDETDTDSELLAKSDLISLQLLGTKGVKLESLNIRTDGYHITEFSATFFPYTFKYQEVYDIECVISIDGTFTAVGSEKIKGFGPDTSPSIEKFENRMKVFESQNYACLEQEYVASDNDGAYSNKTSLSVNASTNGSHYYFWQTPSKEDEAYLRQGVFQLDDTHYAQGIELYDDESLTTKSWYYSSPKVEGKIKDSLPTFKISSKLFDLAGDEEDTYYLKDKYLTTLNFDSSVFDMFITTGSSVTTSAGTFPLTSFSIDMHLEDRIIFTYTYDSMKIIATYSGFGEQEKDTSAPNITYLNLSSSETVATLKQEEDQKTLNSIKQEFGTEDEGLIDEVLKNLPLIPGNSGFAQSDLTFTGKNETHFVIGYLANPGTTVTGTQNNVAAAYTPLYSFLKEGFGYEQENLATEDQLGMLDVLFAKTISYNGKKYKISVHLFVAELNSGYYFIGYTVKVTEVSA